MSNNQEKQTNETKLDEYRIWKEEDIEKLKELCQHNIRFEEIAKILNRTSASCSQKVRKFGISKPFLNKRYSNDENFWIPNQISCYFAGFSAADAALSSRSKEYEFKIAINTRDISLLYDFKKHCSFTGPVKIRPFTIHSGEMCCLSVYSRRWFDDLNKYYNITPRKTFTLQPPNIDDFYLKLCFLIGFIDGDGSICSGKMGKRISIRAVGASYPIIKWCYDLLYEIIEKFSSLKKKTNLLIRDNKYYCFSINNKEAAFLIKFLSSFPVPKLARKWFNPEVIEYINRLEIKKLEVFNGIHNSKILVDNYASSNC